jgi:hypothetical protein
MAARLAAWAAAALCGAAGLALQVQLAACAALPLGHGAGPALALSVFLSAWALGAWAVGRTRWRAAWLLPVLGLLLGLLALPATLLALRGGAFAALTGVAAVAALQGAFLPLLARGALAWGLRTVGVLVACNLLGAWAGAGWIADVAVAAWGRVAAALVAGLCAALAGSSWGCARLRRRTPRARSARRPAPRRWARSRRRS